MEPARSTQINISNNAMIHLMVSLKYDRHILHSLMNQPYNCEEIDYVATLNLA